MLNIKILQLFANNEIVTGAKYFASLSDGEFTVETEGNCEFPFIEANTPFNEITEKQVIEWVKKETMNGDQNLIELGLQKQLEALKIQEPVKAPWVKTTFKPTL